VTAELAAAPANAVIAVTRYSGVASDPPLGTIVSANTAGLAGPCMDGVDSGDYVLDVPTTATNSFVYAAAAMRMKTHFPGAGHDERAEIKMGDGGPAASVAVQDRVVPTVSTARVNAFFNGPVDWAALAAELIAVTTTTATTTTSSTTTTTLLVPLCGAEPIRAEDCRSAESGRSVVRLSDSAARSVNWTVRRGTVSPLSAFGNPFDGSSSYTVCLYDGSSKDQPLLELGVPSEILCANPPCWTALSERGYRFGDRSGFPAGVLGLKLMAGEEGRSQLRLKAAGARLRVADLLEEPLILPTLVQLLVDDGISTACWQSSFSSAKRNTRGRFKAKTP
jgi:hypothetical protein